MQAWNVFYDAENVFYVEAENEQDATDAAVKEGWGLGWKYVEKTDRGEVPS